MSGLTNSELELKLELTQDELRRVGANPALVSLTVGEPVTRTLRSIYFDTPDYRLRAQGISLRVRSDGEAWLQTVKSGTTIRNGISNPTEIEAPVERPEPNLEAIDDRRLRRKLEKALDRSVLEPVFETVVTRTTRQLHSDDGDLELALDDGVVRVGKAENPLCEAELELKSGKPECLLDTATKLFASETVRLAERSKAERGYSLVLGKLATSIEPQRAEPIHLLAKQTCAEAFALIVQSAIRQIEANRQAVLATDDAEASHQLRIGLRRLRTALRAFRPLNDTPALRQLENHARVLARTVGELRDADVLIENTYAPVAGIMKGDPGLVPLRESLLTHRACMRGVVKGALEGQQWSALQLYLALWPRTIKETPALATPVEEFAAIALKKCWKKVARYGKRVESLGPEQKHEMRKALKTLRYTTEFFASLFAERDTRAFLHQVKALQDVFGYINDVVTAGRLNAICNERCADNSEAQRAAGFVLGWHNAEAVHRWQDAHEGWRQLKNANRFWA
jgi:inorganic triphosphatase YgiF